jgi:tetratricopeptide (TPR) repeat protein
MFRLRQDLKSAFQHCQAAVDLDANRVSANPTDGLAKQDLAYTLSQTGSLRWGQGDRSGALNYFERSLAIREALAMADPQNVLVRGSMLYPQSVIGELLLEMGRRQEAMGHLRQAVIIGEARLKRNPEDAGARTPTADAYKLIGDVEDAKARDLPAYHSMACSAYAHATELYRENARRGKVSENERKNSEIAARLTRSCAQLTSTKVREE